MRYSDKFVEQDFRGTGRTLKKDRYPESLAAALLMLPSYRRFPSDQEFRKELVVRAMYNFPRRSYWLRRLENMDRKESVSVDEFTIEHIMPQNEKLSTQWRNDLGPDWERIHTTKLHNIGNLTLTGYNSEYSDRPFPEKRDMLGGFKVSPLRLNQGLGAIDRWDERAIDTRAARLAGMAVHVWLYPELEPGVVDAYRPKTLAAESKYAIEDHPQLAPDRPVRALFEALRSELLSMDATVTEEVLKLYIAYKAETNFVDVVPQASRLRLSFNMPFPELRDPRGMAKDVTNLGRWGNGDVEVALANLDDIPYVLGLARQALDRQLSVESVA